MANNDRPLYQKGNLGRDPLPGTPKMDPFLNPRVNPLDPVIPTDPTRVKQQFEMYEDPMPVLQPRHLKMPEGATSLDFTRLVANVPSGSPTEIYSFTCPPGATTVIYGYNVLAQNAVFPADIEWVPTVDGNRVLRYHGVPDTNGRVRIRFPVSSPTNFGFLVPCQILLQPGQIFTWTAINNTGAPVHMGARTSGYLDFSQRLMSAKFGD